MHTTLLIGSGRLSRHLAFWNSFQKNPLPLATWNRKQNSQEELIVLLQKAARVWLAISDSALIPFFEQHLSDLKIPVIHFSGALHDKSMIDCHPLMSFPEQLMSPENYAKIHFVVTSSNSMALAFPGLMNSFSIISAQEKPFYHALCVVAGNFPQFLWRESLQGFQGLHIPNEAVETYIHQITSNFLQIKDQALTGPLIRKDQTTIEKNLHALENSKLKKIYEAFQGVFT